jgi:hypothetical protein
MSVRRDGTSLANIKAASAQPHSTHFELAHLTKTISEIQRALILPPAPNYLNEHNCSSSSTKEPIDGFGQEQKDARLS